MATDKITEIVDQSAFDQVTKLKAEMKDLSLVFADLLKQAKPLSDSLGGLGKGGGGGISGTTKALDEMDKMLKQLATTRDKIAVADTQVKLALEQEKIALQAVNKEIKDNIKFEKAQEGSVDQMRSKLGLLQKQYDSLGKSAREAMGESMLGNIQKLDTELKKIEGSTGRYQRNVGNYTNATFQLSQVIREIPAFTYSASTGIMALANNAPMLVDAFMQVRKETGSTMAALKIFGASIFSFVNLFSIAVSLFTLFNKQILDFFRDLTKGVPIIDSLTQKYSLMNEAIKSTDYQGAITKVNELTTQINLAKAGVVKKEDALKMYNETIGKTIGYADSLKEAEANLIKNGPAFIQMTYLKSLATAAYDAASKKAIEAEIKRIEAMEKMEKLTDADGNFKPGSLQSLKLLFTQGLGSDADNFEKDLEKNADKKADKSSASSSEKSLEKNLESATLSAQLENKFQILNFSRNLKSKI